MTKSKNSWEYKFLGFWLRWSGSQGAAINLVPPALAMFAGITARVAPAAARAGVRRLSEKASEPAAEEATQNVLMRFMYVSILCVATYRACWC